MVLTLFARSHRKIPCFHLHFQSITIITIIKKAQFNKQLLDEVLVISGIIKVEVSVISRSRRLRLITLTETLIIPDITKTESNNCFIILYLQVISQFLAGSMKGIEKPFLLRLLDIALGNHALRAQPTDYSLISRYRLVNNL